MDVDVDSDVDVVLLATPPAFRPQHFEAAVVDFQSCFHVDPLLPPELLPRPWPGRAARELLAEIRKLGVLSREQHDRPVLRLQRFQSRLCCVYPILEGLLKQCVQFRSKAG